MRLVEMSLRVTQVTFLGLEEQVGHADAHAALDFMDDFTLEGVADKITVPFLVVHGEKDHLVPLEDARRAVASAVNSPRAELVVTTAEYGGEGHCCMDNMQTGVDLIYDWLADVLGADLKAQIRS